MLLKVYTDGSITGGAWGKKKDKSSLPHAWAGWIVKNYLNLPIKWHSWDMGEGEQMSGNVAEYGALRSALNWLYDEFPLASLSIWSDSQLIVNQMNGTFACNKPDLIKWRDECKRLASSFPSITYSWHPRETHEAREADILSKALQTNYGGKPIESYEDLTLRLCKGNK